MNLENLNVVQLSTTEVTDVEGGILPLIIALDLFLWSTMASYIYHSN